MESSLVRVCAVLRSKLVTLPDHRMVDPAGRPREDLAVSRRSQSSL